MPPAPSAAPAASAAPVASAPSAPRNPAPWEDSAPSLSAGDGSAAAAVLEAPARPAVAPQLQQASQMASPAQQTPPVRAMPAQAMPPPLAPQQAQQQADDDDLPPWVTEFSDDTAVAQSAPASMMEAMPAAAPQSARPAPAPARAPHAYVITPVPGLDWDGNWPAVAAALPLRGVAQQLAMQAELIDCTLDGNAHVFRVRVPIETWRTPGNVEKLTAALGERFGRAVRVDTELGAVWYTASAEAQAHRAACQQAAEDTIAGDPFVNEMMRDFGAFVVPGSIVPPAAAA